MDEKETICQTRLFTSRLCEVEFSVEIGCREVAVTKCPAPYSIEVSERTDLGVSSESVSPSHMRQRPVPPSLFNVISVLGTQVSFSDGDLSATGTTFIMPSD